MKILTNEQYKLFLAQQGRIEQLQKENEKLKAQIRAQDVEIDEQAQEIYGLREDIASLKWNLNKPDPKNIDFPNSETEIWNGPKGQIIQPKGTFNKIFNDPDKDQEDKLF